MELSEEEWKIIEKRRKERANENTAPPGVGTGRVWSKARLEKKRFIDKATFVEREGNK